MKKILLGVLTVLACASLNAQVNLDSGLVGCYPFTGNANDQSGHGNNGTVVGATLTKDRFNNANSAYFFHRLANNYISIPNFQAMVPAHDVSISIWGKSIGETSTGLFMTVPDSEMNRFGGFAEYVGGPFLIWDYGNLLSNGRMLFTQNGFDTSWHHYVLIVSKTKNIKEMYEDGALAMSSAYTMDYNNYGRPLYIGAYNAWDGGNGTWNGSLDDVRVYDRALTAAEVTALYTATTSVCPPDAVQSLSQSGIKIYQSSPGKMEIKVGSVPISGSVEVVNVLGQVTMKRVMKVTAYSTQTVDVTNLSTGMYFLVLTSGNERYTQKFIK